jgi:membrane protein DedA with SNARE-associated domain
VGLRRRGWRLLVWGKVTHAAGFAVLIAAGAARMPFLPFLLVSAPLSAAKTALLVGLGWAVGGALAPLMAEPLPLLAGLATLALLALPLILLPPKEHRRHVLPPRFRRPDPRA